MANVFNEIQRIDFTNETSLTITHNSNADNIYYALFVDSLSAGDKILTVAPDPSDPRNATIITFTEEISGYVKVNMWDMVSSTGLDSTLRNELEDFIRTGTGSNVIQAVNLSSSGITQNALLLSDGAGSWIEATLPSAGDFSHGDLANLDADAHPQYLNDSRFDTRLGTKTTDDLTEGANLYHTATRVSFNPVVVLNTAHRTAVTNPHSVTAVQTGAIPLTEKGLPTGVATLDGSGKVPTAQIPASALPTFSVVATLLERAALIVQEGDECYVQSSGTQYIYDGTTWFERPGSADGVTNAASTTDNAIARFDGTTGKVVQNSNVTIDDAGNLTLPGTVDGVDLAALDTSVATHHADGANPHGTGIDNIGSGTLAQLNAAISDATLDNSSASRTPTSHASSHAQGGSDSLSILDLAVGSLASGEVVGSDGTQLIAVTPVTDHGALTGLSDDDHTQYLNTSRHNTAFDARLATKDTDDLSEGTNLYHTTARASAAAPVQSVNGATGSVTLGTDEVSEGASNLYHTEARVNANTNVVANTSHRGLTNNPHGTSLANLDDGLLADLNALISDATLDDASSARTPTSHASTHATGGSDALVAQNLSSGAAPSGQMLETNGSGGFTLITTPTGVTDHGALTGLGDDDHTQYLNASRHNAAFDTRLATKDTDDLSEGANLYHTEARVNANANVAANTTHRSDTTNPHSTSISNLVAGTLAQLNSKVSNATLDDSSSPRTPLGHASSHEAGGSDALVAQNLSSDSAASGRLLETDGAGGFTLIATPVVLTTHSQLSGLGADDHPQYINATRFNSSFAAKSTSDLSEGTRLYYTEARVAANPAVTSNSAHRVLTTNPHSVTAAQVGAIPTTQKGVASGVASLDSTGKVPVAQIPASALPAFKVVATLTARNALTVQEGDESYVTSQNKQYIYDGTAWFERPVATNTVQHGSSSTDNALVRFDGLTGKTLQNSNATLDDAGNLTLAGNLILSGTVDGIDVSNLNTSLTSHVASTSNPHGTSLANIGVGTLAQLNSKVSDATLDAAGTARPPTSHASAHLAGGSDALVAQNLSSGAATSGQIMQTNGSGGFTLVNTPTVVTDHGALTGLGDDDHTQYLNASRHNTAFDSRLATKDTDDVSEGASNLYHTTARASAAAPVQSVNGATGSVVLDTDDVSEGSSNLYHTESRVNANTNVAANTSHRTNSNNPHNTGIANLVAGTLAQLNSKVSDATLDAAGTARPPTSHAGTHSAGGSDELTVQNLGSGAATSGQLLETDGAGGFTLITTPTGITDHGALGGLGDDDHTQYLNTSRHNTAFDTRLATKDTDDLSEGTNLYHTTARASAAAPVQSVNGATGSVTLDTDDISEGATNLYHTTARASAAAPVQSVNGATGAVSLNSDNVAEGSTNLYFTTARVNANTNVAASTTHRTATNNPHNTSISNLVAGTLAQLNSKVSNANLDAAGTARPPTAHTSTHSAGGSDALVAQNLSSGAAASGQLLQTNGAGGFTLITTPTGVTDHGALTGLGDDDHTQYLNTARHNTAFDSRLATKDTDDVSEGATNLYHTTARASAAAPVQSVNGATGSVTLDTDDISEGTNLYYTEARVNSNTNVAANTTHRGQTNNPHGTDIGNLGAGTLAELNSKISNATLDDASASRTPTTHASTHAVGGSDVLSAQSLSSGAATSGQTLIADGSGGWTVQDTIASGYRDLIWAEESATISTATNSGFQWSFGNGAETSQNDGITLTRGGAITALSLQIAEGSGTVELYVNGVATGQSVSASGTNGSNTTILGSPVAVVAGDIINFQTTASSGNTNGGRVAAELEVGTAPTTYSLLGASDVSGTPSDGDSLVWVSANSRFEVQTGGSGGVSESATASIASGFTQGLEQEILKADGQLGKTVLAVGYTTDGKAQCTSLGDGNVAFVYASGADFTNNIVLEGPVFLSLGEVYVFENLSNGSIITFTEGGYGFSGQVSGGDMSPMPLLTLGLSFKDTFFFGFRNFNAAGNEGQIHIVNGPVKSSVTLYDGNNIVVNSYLNIELDPWEYIRFIGDGAQEYRLISDNAIMACTNANMDSAGFYDSRLIMPLTNDGITWPRSGNMSAPYTGTSVDYYTRDNAEGTFVVSPGSPIAIDGATGATDSDYEPDGATRFRAKGLVTAYSGADSAGLEATPMWPVASFVQRIALPLSIRDAGDGGNNGIAIASPYSGTARVYEWDPVAGSASLVYTVPLTRTGVTITVGDDQLHPAAGLVANETTASPQLSGDFEGGYLEADVPVHVVFNSEQNFSGDTKFFRGTGGASVAGINANDDEQATTGITPNEIRTEVVRNPSDGLLYIREIATENLGSALVSKWRLA
jgi:hypothetical protein